jgi:hypothetical protein
MVTKPPSTFSASDQRSRAVLDQIEKERAATDAKTARLKALRMAKEEEEKTLKASQPAVSKPRTKRVT